jgi:hypothetical protein
VHPRRPPSLARTGAPALVLASMLGALTLAGCGERTAILVRITSPDLAIPADVDRLEVVIVGGASGASIERGFAVATDWPHTLSIRPGERESGAVSITVTARRGGGLVVARTASARFVAGREEIVEVVLEGACRGVICPPGVDCIGGECEQALPDGGIPIDGDLPIADGAVDGGDGASGGCTRDAECDDGIPCTLDRCLDAACTIVPEDMLCAVGSVCDPATGCPPRPCTDDPECNDDRVCNGVETCGSAGICVRGVAVSCDDADRCTDDRCDEEMRGACLRSTRDADRDLHGDPTCPATGGIPADDCNEASPDVFPGAPEVCNGLDDDCAAGCDDGFACCRGAIETCATDCGTEGARTCDAGCEWGACVPPAELCNGLDDDCSGTADDGLECVQGATQPCITDCGSTGAQTCDSTCSWGACVAPADVCNGLDDDCSGTADDGLECIGGSTTPCDTACGTVGARLCDLTSCTLDACTPPAEGCNSRDDDCDTRVDEMLECVPGETGSCTTTCGSTGTHTCGSTCTFGTCTPPAEICNGADDDCDGTIDDGFTCVPGATTSCATGCGTTGTQTCSAMCRWGGCRAPTDVCNGRDDDCDSMCDELSACCAGTTGTCTTTCGSTGSRTCSGACGWTACAAPAEVCNGIDDDCNGVCDDGGACCAGRSGACTTTCGTTGSRVCSSSCAWGTCAPPAETCNGADDDCDGMVDDGFACAPGAMQTCPTACGTTGSRVCTAACGWPACTPPAEACNGLDDDCDGTPDEGCGTCIGCTGAIAISGAGGRYTGFLQPSAHTGSCGGAGSELRLTFTTTTVQDVFIATHGAGLDTVLYVRECACAGTEVACNDDAHGMTTSALQLTSLPAGTYQLFVDTEITSTAAISVDVYLSDPGAESDRCGRPTVLVPGTTRIAGDTCAFGNDYDLAPVPGCTATSGDAQDRVYAFYVGAAGTFTLDGCGSTGPTYDSTVWIRNVCTDGTSAAQLACNDDGAACSGTDCATGLYRSQLSAPLAPGLYYLMVDGYGGGCQCGAYDMALGGF